MTATVDLETPAIGENLYLAQGEEVAELLYRPAFTGDVYRLPEGRLVALVQHPCAMRRGIKLSDKLLVCAVLADRGPAPANWNLGNFRRMFLPNLNGSNHTVEFDDFEVVTREELENAERIAVLSMRGVNLLVQRWVHHNSRVIVKTSTIYSLSSGPFDEADLQSEACADLVEAGETKEAAAAQVDDWLGKIPDGGSTDRRQMLTDPQQKSVVRSSLRRQIREWKS